VRPIFLLFLDAVSQLIKQNPLAFEMNCKYIAKLARLVFTNRYFEFVQSDEFVSLDIVARQRAEPNVANEQLLQAKKSKKIGE